VWCRTAAFFTQEVRTHAIGVEIVATKFALIRLLPGGMAGTQSGCPLMGSPAYHKLFLLQC
jgi:hypothetical protein